MRDLPMVRSSYLVLDLEATCDDTGAIPRGETETIEIGAVVASMDAEADGGIVLVDEFQTFIRPVRHPRLTAFCTRLTTITQLDVDGAPGFVEAIARLARFLAPHRRSSPEGAAPLFTSWGDYDANQLGREAAHHGIALPFGREHLNLKKLFSATLGESRRYGMAEALERVGLPLHGVHHRGIDDARNIARLLPHALGRAAARSP